MASQPTEWGIHMYAVAARVEIDPDRIDEAMAMPAGQLIQMLKTRREVIASA